MPRVSTDVLLERVDRQVERLLRDHERAFWSAMLTAAPDADVDILESFVEAEWSSLRKQWAAERPRIVAALREA